MHVIKNTSIYKCTSLKTRRGLEAVRVAAERGRRDDAAGAVHETLAVLGEASDLAADSMPCVPPHHYMGVV